MRCFVTKTIQVNGDVYVPGSLIELKDDDALALAEKDLVAFTVDDKSEIQLPTEEELAAEEAEKARLAAEQAAADADAKPDKANAKAAK